ncbi:MAG: glycosyltransferase [Spirochaetota bacterium]|nr:glycosyltransferase [Spirochaetota bacterium]
MNIGLQTWGSDGDILPFIALADGLSSAGHEVTLFYTSIDNKDYSPLGKSFNIKLIKVYDKFELDADKVFRDVTKFINPLNEFALVLEKYFDPAVEEMYEASKNLCIENDLVIGHIVNHTLLTAAEKYKCPRVSLALFTNAIQSKYMSPLGINLGKFINTLSWKLGDYLVRKKCFKSANNIRLQEGLPPIKSLSQELYISKELTLISSSEVLTPRHPDWKDYIEICGHLKIPNIDSQWEIPHGLRRFLDDGEPPVYLSFGSCTQFDLEDTTRLFVDSVNLSGKRAIIQSDWEHISSNYNFPNIYKVTRIPHEKIFPHCSMVVHHGGAGITNTSLTLGKPSLVVAHAFDQPYWGKRLENLELGKLLYRRSTTPKKIAKEIINILNSSQIKNNVERVSRIMNKENGVIRAVELIEKRFIK